MDNEITINGEVYVKKASLNLVTIKYEDDTIDQLAQLPIASQEALKDKPWPQEGDEFWFIDYYGTVRNTKTWVSSDHEWKEKLIKFGNFFKTKEEAEMYALRIESLSKGLIFGIDQEGWIYNFQDECPLKTKALTIYPKFPTEEECQEWYDNYGKSWEYLLKK